MTVMESMARQIEGAAEFLGHFLTTTKPEYLDWKPKAEGHESKTRSAMEQISECVGVNNRTIAALQGVPFEWVDHKFASAEEARNALVESAKRLAEVLVKHDERVLVKSYAMPWGEITGGFMLGIAMANMHYHCGQINFIQCLYGDDVFHMPGGE